MMICGSYSPGYTDQAERLFRSCEALGQPCGLEPMEEMGTWRLNVRAKIAAVHAAVQRYERVMWVDADAVVLEEPRDDWAEDFVCRMRPASKQRNEKGLAGGISTGTMFFRRTTAVLGMLARWPHWQTQAEAKTKGHGHEPGLYYAMREAEEYGGMTVGLLPWEYIVVQGGGGRWANLVNNEWIIRDKEIPDGTIVAHYYTKAART
jgi:hypothetical protein